MPPAAPGAVFGVGLTTEITGAVGLEEPPPRKPSVERGRVTG
jgi:hypothetical protein